MTDHFLLTLSVIQLVDNYKIYHKPFKVNRILLFQFINEYPWWYKLTKYNGLSTLHSNTLWNDELNVLLQNMISWNLFTIRIGICIVWTQHSFGLPIFLLVESDDTLTNSHTMYTNFCQGLPFSIFDVK